MNPGLYNENLNVYIPADNPARADTSGAKTGLPGPWEKEFVIPEKYDMDMLRIMPVNKTTCFTYWELTDGLLESGSISPADVVAKVFEIRNRKEVQLYEFGIGQVVGKHYVSCRSLMKKIMAKAGYYDAGGVFVPLLISNVTGLSADNEGDITGMDMRSMEPAPSSTSMGKDFLKR